MKSLPSGSRVKINSAKFVKVKTKDRNFTLGAALVLIKNTQKEVLSKKTGSEFTMIFPEDISGEQVVHLLLYSHEEHQIGYIQDEDIYVTIDEETYIIENRKEKTTAVILLEYYRRGDNYQLRVRGDGYTFGIRAYARKENLNPRDFLLEDQQHHENRQRPYSHAPEIDRRLQGSGSGVIVSRRHIITNAHVVDRARYVDIRGSDGSSTAEIITIDQKHDLALLRTSNDIGEAIGLRLKRLNLGERVIAAGYPLRDILGDDLKVTQGNISGLKGFEGDVSAFQFTAPIGSGSSGGAIVDHNGNLTGIVSSSLAHGELRQRGAISENMNFAIKTSTVREMLDAHDIDSETSTSGIMEVEDLVRIVRKSVVSVLLS